MSESKTWDDYVDDVQVIMERNGAQYILDNISPEGLRILVKNCLKLRKERDEWVKHSHDWEMLYRGRRGY